MLWGYKEEPLPLSGLKSQGERLVPGTLRVYLWPEVETQSQRMMDGLERAKGKTSQLYLLPLYLLLVLTTRET